MLADAAEKDAGKSDKKPAVAVAIEVEQPSTLMAASRLLAAISQKDATKVDDALHMWKAACEAEYEEEDSEDSAPSMPSMKGSSSKVPPMSSDKSKKEGY